jgi:hypothetical protein
MVPVETPKTNEKFASREKILKWKTGIRPWAVCARNCLEKQFRRTLWGIDFLWFNA